MKRTAIAYSTEQIHFLTRGLPPPDPDTRQFEIEAEAPDWGEDWRPSPPGPGQRRAVLTVTPPDPTELSS